jgi:hypothetical protein
LNDRFDLTPHPLSLRRLLAHAGVEQNVGVRGADLGS